MTDPAAPSKGSGAPRAARGSSPAGLTELGTPIPVQRRPRWGFHAHNERLHGRLAMLGFIALVALEWKLGHGILISP